MENNSNNDSFYDFNPMKNIINRVILLNFFFQTHTITLSASDIDKVKKFTWCCMYIISGYSVRTMYMSKTRYMYLGLWVTKIQFYLI